MMRFYYEIRQKDGDPVSGPRPELWSTRSDAWAFAVHLLKRKSETADATRERLEREGYTAKRVKVVDL